MDIRHKNIGSKLDDFLKEEGLLAEAEETAIKRVIFPRKSGHGVKPDCNSAALHYNRLASAMGQTFRANPSRRVSRLAPSSRPRGYDVFRSAAH